MGTVDTSIELSKAAVVGGEDGVLEATGILQVDVELAVLAVLCDGDTLAHGGNIRVEDERHGGAIVGDNRCDSALRTASTAIGDLYKLSERSFRGRGVSSIRSQSGLEMHWEHCQGSRALVEEPKPQQELGEQEEL